MECRRESRVGGSPGVMLRSGAMAFRRRFRCERTMMIRKRISVPVAAALLAGMVSCMPDVPDMVYVAGGTFDAGSVDSLADDDERPLLRVEVESFYLGAYEVTQSEWTAVMGENPSRFRGGERPVECVSWYDVQRFIRRLNRRTGRRYRLPTEIEWEFAARGGVRNDRGLYSGGDLENVAWCASTAGGETHDVGGLQPNELGIFDMTGNVHEWCADTYDSLLYVRSAGSGAAAEWLPGDEVTVRGGSWDSDAKYSRTANRNHVPPATISPTLGFRLAMDAP